MSFKKLGLSFRLLSILDEIEYLIPTPIQSQTIPDILKGHDLLAEAQTGTGKSAAFILPLIDKLLLGKKSRGSQIRVLILAPTRELVLQLKESIDIYGRGLGLNSLAAYGGVKVGPQLDKLSSGVDILIATPGRLIDLNQRKAVDFSILKTLVLDEADRMLDPSFMIQFNKINKSLPKTKQVLLFSATFTNELREYGKSLMVNPVELSAISTHLTTETIDHFLYSIDQHAKTKAFIKLYKLNSWKQVLIFTSTKKVADALAKELCQKKFKAKAIHADKNQDVRIDTLQEFKNRELDILVATEIISRGIDIGQNFQVVNYDLPKRAELYVHRIGRTGRAGKKGQAISLVSAGEFELLKAIESLLKVHIERKELKGFTPSIKLPISAFD